MVRSFSLARLPPRPIRTSRTYNATRCAVRSKYSISCGSKTLKTKTPKAEGAVMSIRQPESKRFSGACLVAVLVAFSYACSRPPEAANAGVRQMPAGKEFSGFLSDYAKLKPNPEFEKRVASLRDNRRKKNHKYVAIIVEPVAVYVATNAD